MSTSSEKVAILVDVQNIYYTTRQAFQSQFNYYAFWEEVTRDREVLRAIAFAIEPANGKQKGFQQILKDIGFEVHLKPYIQRQDGSAKADWDVGITLEMIDAAEKADTIILASGDGDFDLAVRRVNERFMVKTVVYGVESLTARTLADAADEFHPIGESLLMSR